MGRRSRKRRPGDLSGTTTPDAPAAVGGGTTERPSTDTLTFPEDPPAFLDANGEPVSKSERRNIEARAALVPLAPGERPTAVTVAAVAAVVLATANIVLMLSGYKVRGAGASPGGAIAFAVVMLIAAWGMWHLYYWAVLGFQALVAVVVVIASLSLMVASAWQGALLCLVIIGLGGWLFWKLVRALARIQMPKYERG